MGIIMEGIEFRPVVHDGSYLLAERSSNCNIIETTHVHGTRDHDKNDEDIDEYWEKKLPHDYPQLLEMPDIPLNYTTKKELYQLFCRGFLANNGQLVMKGLSECKALERNIRRIRVKDIVKEVKDYLKTYSSAGMDIS
ncbi:hypothetical protein Tco_0107072, partial [Tanacetum coccineum]